jgi:uncharacterized membrane protein
MLRKIALAFVFLWFFLGGLAHFAFTDVEMRIVPPLLPWPRQVVWLTGVMELAGALALLHNALRRRAGWFLIVVTVLVTPANVYMLLHADRFPGVPLWLLIMRLPAQVALILCIGWATREDRVRTIG